MHRTTLLLVAAVVFMATAQATTTTTTAAPTTTTAAPTTTTAAPTTTTAAPTTTTAAPTTTTTAAPTTSTTDAPTTTTAAPTTSTTDAPTTTTTAAPTTTTAAPTTSTTDAPTTSTTDAPTTSTTDAPTTSTTDAPTTSTTDAPTTTTTAAPTTTTTAAPTTSTTDAPTTSTTDAPTTTTSDASTTAAGPTTTAAAGDHLVWTGAAEFTVTANPDEAGTFGTVAIGVGSVSTSGDDDLLVEVKNSFGATITSVTVNGVEIAAGLEPDLVSVICSKTIDSWCAKSGQVNDVVVVVGADNFPLSFDTTGLAVDTLVTLTVSKADGSDDPELTVTTSFPTYGFQISGETADSFSTDIWAEEGASANGVFVNLTTGSTVMAGERIVAASLLRMVRGDQSPNVVAAVPSSSASKLVQFVEKISPEASENATTISEDNPLTFDGFFNSKLLYTLVLKNAKENKTEETGFTAPTGTGANTWVWALSAESSAEKFANGSEWDIVAFRDNYNNSAIANVTTNDIKFAASAGFLPRLTVAYAPESSSTSGSWKWWHTLLVVGGGVALVGGVFFFVRRRQNAQSEHLLSARHSEYDTMRG